MTRDTNGATLRPMRPDGWEDYRLPGPVPAAPAPTLLVRRGVLSPQLRNYRDILVAVPASAVAGGRRYPVVYLHDGQNLFDPATSYVEPWGLLERLERLARSGTEVIVVGIPNMGRLRRYEYSPFRDLLHGGGGGDRYLAFLVETVKPLVDRDFPTRPGPADTVLGGASLGGLVSLYGAVRHPGVFGVASIQSPALWFADGAVFAWLAEREFPARFHLDVGGDEGEATVTDVRRLHAQAVAAGHLPGATFSYQEEAGAGHHETAWGRRFEAALPFLLQGATPA